MNFAAFFNKYFLAPLYAGDAPYNIYNTLVYAVILIAAVFGVYKVLKKLDVKIDFNFFLALTPYILLASVLRVVRDAGIFKCKVLVSPLIYFAVFGIAFSSLLIFFELGKGFNFRYDIPMFFFGLALIVYFGNYLGINNITPLLQITGITALFGGIIYTVRYATELEVLSPLNIYVLIAAMFDAASTFVGVALYDYVEKHVLPNLLFGAFGPWVMFPLKFGVVILALFVIDSSEEDKYLKNFLKFAILCVTLGPGLRNTLRIIMGV